MTTPIGAPLGAHLIGHRRFGVRCAFQRRGGKGSCPHVDDLVVETTPTDAEHVRAAVPARQKSSPGERGRGPMPMRRSALLCHAASVVVLRCTICARDASAD